MVEVTGAPPAGTPTHAGGTPTPQPVGAYASAQGYEHSGPVPGVSPTHFGGSSPQAVGGFGAARGGTAVTSHGFASPSALGGGAGFGKGAEYGGYGSSAVSGGGGGGGAAMAVEDDDEPAPVAYPSHHGGGILQQAPMGSDGGVGMSYGAGFDGGSGGGIPVSASGAGGRKVGVGAFALLKVVGKGSFGKVMQVRKRDTGRVYAMKVLTKSNIIKRNQVEHTRTERNVLGRIVHPFIVGLNYAFQTQDKLFLVLDYCSGGELFFHLGREGKFEEDRARFYAAQIVLALEHLHSLNVIYRDLKPENVLLDHKGNVRLTDFGLSKENVEGVDSGAHSFCGTPEYLAPEVLNRTGHGRAVDWWSLGALLYEMLTGLPPFYCRDRNLLFEKIRKGDLDYPDYLSPEARDILMRLLNRDPRNRLGCGPGDAAELRAHPFFRTIDWKALLNGKIPAPWVPAVASSMDTSQFDAEFTNMPVHSPSSRAEQVGSHAAKFFEGFTYVAPHTVGGGAGLAPNPGAAVVGVVGGSAFGRGGASIAPGFGVGAGQGAGGFGPMGAGAGPASGFGFAPVVASSSTGSSSAMAISSSYGGPGMSMGVGSAAYGGGYGGMAGGSGMGVGGMGIELNTDVDGGYGVQGAWDHPGADVHAAHAHHAGGYGGGMMDASYGADGHSHMMAPLGGGGTSTFGAGASSFGQGTAGGYDPAANPRMSIDVGMSVM
jgi:serine/threonine protein kinase